MQVITPVPVVHTKIPPVCVKRCQFIPVKNDYKPLLSYFWMARTREDVDIALTKFQDVVYDVRSGACDATEIRFLSYLSESELEQLFAPLLDYKPCIIQIN
jgi:hypothetical protein